MKGDDCCDEEKGGEGNVKADVCGSAGGACGDYDHLASTCCGEIDRCGDEEESGAGKETQGCDNKDEDGRHRGIEAIAMWGLAVTEQHEAT